MVRQGRSLRRAGLIGVLAATMLVLSTSTASAHSYFFQSDPADGSILEHAPARVVLIFSAAVDAGYTTVELVEAGGSRYVASSVAGYPGQQNILVVSLPQVPNGAYRLTFSTRDAVDLHQTAGTIVFGIGVAPPASAPVPKPVPAVPSEVLVRWFAFAGLAGVLGGISFGLIVTGRLPEVMEVRARVQRAVFGMALLGSGAVIVGETGLLAIQASSLGPILPSIGRLLNGSEFGARWLVSTLLAIGTAALLLSMWSSSRKKEVRSLSQEIRVMRAWSLFSIQVRVIVLAAALTAAVAFSGHFSGSGGRSMGGEAVLALHTGAMGVWAGGVVALALALTALRSASGQLERSSLMALVVGFGPVAAVSFSALAVSGLLLSGLQVASITSLLSTQYGTVLIAKVGLVGLIALFGLRHAVWTWRGLGRSRMSGRFPKRLPVTIALEAIGAIAIVLLASVLGASAPAQGQQFDPPATSATATQLTQVKDQLLITVSVKPNRPGPNLVSVVLVDERRPAIAQIQRVTVLVHRPDDVTQGVLLATTRTNQTVFDAGSVKLNAGDVKFTVRVVRPTLADTVTTQSWKVDAQPVERAPVVVSNQRLAPIVNLLALLGGLGAVVMIAAGAIRHRRADRQIVDRPSRPDRLNPGRAPNRGRPAILEGTVLMGHNELGVRPDTRHDRPNSSRNVYSGSPARELRADE